MLLKLAPGWALIRVNFDPTQEIWPKVRRGWVLPYGWALFHDTMVTLRRQIIYTGVYTVYIICLC